MQRLMKTVWKVFLAPRYFLNIYYIQQFVNLKLVILHR